MEMNFCRRCGSKLSHDKASLYKCTNGHAIYLNSAPTVGVFIFNEQGDLLVSRRCLEPGKGMLDSIGGFVDGLESVEEAAMREIQEETGLKESDYSQLEFVCTASSSYAFDGEKRNVLSSFFVTQLVDGAKAVAADDVAEIVAVSLDEINLDLFHGEDVKKGLKILQELVLVED